MTNVLIVAPFDNGGQGISLSNALNKHSEHESRCLTLKQTYLNYETDILFPDYNTPTRILELRNLLRGTDFFIFLEYVPEKTMEKLGLLRQINNRNTIISLGGSYSRAHADEHLLKWWREDHMFAGGYMDWSIVGKIGRMAFTNNILPIDKMPEPKHSNDIIRVCFAPTKKEKGIAEYKRVMDTLMEKYDHVEAVPIIKKSWSESVKIKSESNITFNQLRRPTYANSAIESMYLQHAVLSRIDSWTLSLFPDLPIINIETERDLYESLKELIEDPKEIKKRGEKGKEFVEKWHAPKRVAKSWENLINFVKNEM